MSKIHSHVQAFNALIQVMRETGFAFIGAEARKPKLLDGETPEAFAERAAKLKERMRKKDAERISITFPAMSSGKKALATALKLAGWRPVSLDLFPKEEQHLVRDKRTQQLVKQQKLAYHIETSRRLDDKTRPKAVLCPQDGLLELMSVQFEVVKTPEETRHQAELEKNRPSAPPRLPMPRNEKGRLLTKLSPNQWDLERFKPLLPLWVKAGMNEEEAREAALDGLCSYHDSTPEHLRIEMCKKAIKRWAPLSRELEGLDKYRERIVEWVPAGTKQEEAIDLIVSEMAPLLTHLPEDWRLRRARQAVMTWGPVGREDDPTISSEEQLARLAKSARKVARRLKREQVALEPKSLAEVVSEFNHRRQHDAPVQAVPNGRVRVGLVDVPVGSPAPAPKQLTLADRLEQALSHSSPGSAMAQAFAHLRK